MIVKKFEEIEPYVLTHLIYFESNFNNCFPERTLQQHEWMQNPFAVTVDEKMSPFCKSQGVCDTALENDFEALSLPEFWILVKKEHFGTLTTSY